MPFSIRKHDGKFQVVNSDTGDVKGTHGNEDDAKKQLAALYANGANKDKGHMDIQVKSMTAELVPVENDDTSGPGALHVIASTERRDRDGDQLWADEWEQPLPEHVQVIGDHDNNHILSTVGSGTPTLEADNKIHVRGSYAETQYAQDVRKLVNGKHLRNLSVAYREKRGQKGVSRELINVSFVNVPSNVEAVVVESKSAVKPSDMPGALDASKITRGTFEDQFKSFGDNLIQQMSAGKSYLPAGFTAETEMDAEKQFSTLVVKDSVGNVLLSHRFSQAPEAHPTGSDSTADQAKDALVIAKAKAMAMSMETRHLIDEED